MLRLKLSLEHVGLSSGLIHVDRTLVDTLLFFAFNKLDRFTVDNGHDRELLLRLRLLKTARLIPSGTFNLEAEHVGAIARLFLGKIIDLPVHAFLDLSLNVEPVELNCVTSSCHLLDCCQERLRVVQSIDEGDVWLFRWIFFPGVELLETLLDVIQPRAESSGRLEG